MLFILALQFSYVSIPYFYKSYSLILVTASNQSRMVEVRLEAEDASGHGDRRQRPSQIAEKDSRHLMTNIQEETEISSVTKQDEDVNKDVQMHSLNSETEIFPDSGLSSDHYQSSNVSHPGNWVTSEEHTWGSRADLGTQILAKIEPDRADQTMETVQQDVIFSKQMEIKLPLDTGILERINHSHGERSERGRYILRDNDRADGDQDQQISTKNSNRSDLIPHRITDLTSVVSFPVSPPSADNISEYYYADLLNRPKSYDPIIYHSSMKPHATNEHDFASKSLAYLPVSRVSVNNNRERRQNSHTASADNKTSIEDAHKYTSTYTSYIGPTVVADGAITEVGKTFHYLLGTSTDERGDHGFLDRSTHSDAHNESSGIRDLRNAYRSDKEFTNAGKDIDRDSASFADVAIQQTTIDSDKNVKQLKSGGPMQGNSSDTPTQEVKLPSFVDVKDIAAEKSSINNYVRKKEHMMDNTSTKLDKQAQITLGERPSRIHFVKKDEISAPPSVLPVKPISKSYLKKFQSFSNLNVVSGVDDWRENTTSEEEREEELWPPPPHQPPSPTTISLLPPAYGQVQQRIESTVATIESRPESETHKKNDAPTKPTSKAHNFVSNVKSFTDDDSGWSVSVAVPILPAAVKPRVLDNSAPDNSTYRKINRGSTVENSHRDSGKFTPGINSAFSAPRNGSDVSARKREERKESDKTIDELESVLDQAELELPDLGVRSHHDTLRFLGRARNTNATTAVSNADSTRNRYTSRDDLRPSVHLGHKQHITYGGGSRDNKGSSSRAAVGDVSQGTGTSTLRVLARDPPYDTLQPSSKVYTLSF